MTIRRAAGVLAAVGVGLLVMAATPAARAQVKLEYKYPEGQTMTYKTTSKTTRPSPSTAWRSRPTSTRRW